MKKNHSLNEDVASIQKLAGLNEGIDKESAQELLSAIYDLLDAAGNVRHDVIAARIGQMHDVDQLAKLVECLNYSTGFLGTIK